MVMSRFASFASSWVQLLRCGGAEINANLLHDGKNLWMHSQTWLGACRDSFSLGSVGKLVEESSGHL
jgi:hypothetical protein